MTLTKHDIVYVPDPQGIYWVNCKTNLGCTLKGVQGVYVITDKQFNEIQDRIEFLEVQIRFLENKLNNPQPF